MIIKKSFKQFAEDQQIKSAMNTLQTGYKKHHGLDTGAPGARRVQGSGGPLGSYVIKTQSQINKSNNKKLPLGLQMTDDGQSVNFGKKAGDIVRDVGTQAQDPKYSNALQKKGKEFGYNNLTGKKFQKIANTEADNLQTSINRNIKGTEANRLGNEADTINQNTKKYKK